MLVSKFVEGIKLSGVKVKELWLESDWGTKDWLVVSGVLEERGGYGVLYNYASFGLKSKKVKRGLVEVCVGGVWEDILESGLIVGKDMTMLHIREVQLEWLLGGFYGVGEVDLSELSTSEGVFNSVYIERLEVTKIEEIEMLKWWNPSIKVVELDLSKYTGVIDSELLGGVPVDFIKLSSSQKLEGLGKMVKGSKALSAIMVGEEFKCGVHGVMRGGKLKIMLG